MRKLIRGDYRHHKVTDVEGVTLDESGLFPTPTIDFSKVDGIDGTPGDYNVDFSDVEGISGTSGDYQVDTIGGYNYIINGSFQVAQRSPAYYSSCTGTGYQCADRWFNPNSNLIIDRPYGANDRGAHYRLSPQSTETYIYVRQAVELNLETTGIAADKVNGNWAVGEQWTISFWLYGSTPVQGYVNVYFNDGITGATNAVTIYGSSTLGTLATGWRYVTATFTVPTVMNGTNQLVSVNVGGKANPTMTLGDNVRVTKVKLERGPIATPFEVPLYTEDLGRCLRYYIETYSSRVGFYQGWSTSTNQFYSNGSWPVPMYKTPTYVLTNVANPVTSPTLGWVDNLGFKSLTSSSSYAHGTQSTYTITKVNAEF